MSGDPNAILRVWIAAQPALIALVGSRIYSPRVPEGIPLPALAFFCHGGNSNAHIRPIVEPAYQIDCWGRNPIEARSVYTAVYDALQGAEQQSVVVGGTTYRILSAVEEMPGQDLQEVDPHDYHRVVGFFQLVIQTDFP